MRKRAVQPGRPKGRVTSDPIVAVAFGASVRSRRTALGLAQEALAHLVMVERSHMGKIERGEHMPTLTLVLRISKALGVSSADLMRDIEALIPDESVAQLS